MTTKTIVAQIDDELLPELGRMFGGWTSVLREILQNAYRAGANNVVVTLNPEGTLLEIRDDGVGCADLQLLLTAGKTGWDPHAVTDPGKVGFYALLNPEFVTLVEVESRGQYVKLDPEHVLRRQPVIVEEASFESGLRLRLHLKNPQEAQRLKNDLREARSFYPFQLTLNGEALLAPNELFDLELNTPVGRVCWKADFHSYDCLPVWEYRAVESEDHNPTRQIFWKAAAAHPLAPLAKAIIESGQLLWFVDPTSGVRPKLPDRSSLILGDHLEAAVAIAVNELVNQVLERVRHITAKWPARLPDKKQDPQLWHRLPTWATDTIVKEALVSLGWHYARYRDPNSVVTRSNPEDGVRVEHAYQTLFDRDAIPVADEATVMTINFLFGQQQVDFTAYCDAEPSALVDIQGLRPPKNEGLVWLADTITVAGRPLPFLLREEEDEINGPVVIANHLAGALELMKQDELALGIFGHLLIQMYWHGDLDLDIDLIDWLDEADDPDWETIRATLLLQLVEAYGTKKELTALRKYYAVKSAHEKMAEAIRALRMCKTGDRDLDRESKAAVRLIQTLHRRAEKVRRQAGLAAGLA